jgi:hypothetical protein
MKKQVVILLGIVLFSLFGCQKEMSDTVDQDKIYASYVLEYNSNQGVTYARTNFHFSNFTGTKLELAEPAEVLVDGEILPFKPLLAMYEKSFVGLKSSAAFTYTDIDGNVFSNAVEMVDSIAFPEGLDSISRSETIELTWEGSPVQEDESVIITINGSGEQDGEIFTQTGVNATSILLTQDRLADLGLENATFYIRRVKNIQADDVTSAGGNLIARYDGMPVTVYVKP